MFTRVLIPNYFYNDVKKKRALQQRLKVCTKIIESYKLALEAWKDLNAEQQSKLWIHQRFNIEIERLERLQKELSDK